MTFSEILNIFLGGGLIALVVSVITLKATVRKANADAEKAKAEAEKAYAETEAVKLTNAENATRILVENIVKPLKEELNATRKDLQATKREMSRLRKAVEAASSCSYSPGCPVLGKLRDNQKDNSGEGDIDGNGKERLFGKNLKRGRSRTDSDESDEDDDSDGQPP